MATRNIQLGPAPYATGADFCKIFESNMDRLYLLSYILTASEELAEKCFVQGLEDARNGNRVFKEWAESWARRTIIMNAIRAVRPWPVVAQVPASEAASAGLNTPEIRALVTLPNFERFVFVLSVIEKYSDRECALLFGCTRDAVVKARVHAVQFLGDSDMLKQQLSTIENEKQLRPERSLGISLLPLAVSA